MFLFCFWSCFSQTSFDSIPENAKEIHFVYEVKSNYYVNESGVFADTLLFQVDFPKLKFSKVTNPNNSAFVCGVVEWKDFNNENKKKLSSILYHTNEKIEGEFNVKKNVTIIRVERNDDLTRAVFKKYLKKSYSHFEYTITINYNNKTIGTRYPSVEYSNEFKNKSKEIVYDMNGLSGTFKEDRNEFEFENKIILNDKLNNKIIPGELFSNNSFGVEKIYTVTKTTELKSVYYK